MCEPYRYLAVVLLLSAVGIGLGACGEGDWREDLPKPIDRDLADIQERDTLHVLTTSNSTSFFLYRGQEMGYEHDILKAFADDHDLEVKFHVQRSRDSIYQRLNEGVGDIVAARVVPMAADSAHISFTEELYTTQPTIVQRRDTTDGSALPESVDTVIRKGTGDEAEAPIADLAEPDTTESIDVRARLVQRPSQLAGERIPLPYRSEYANLLVELSDSLQDEIVVVELDTATSYEKVIRYVASGEFDLTVSPNNLAQLSEGYFANIRARPTIGPTHDIAFAVRTNAEEFRRALDEWIVEHRDGPLFERLYQQYFIDRRGYNERTESRYLTSETGQLSEYDDLFRSYADSIGWDWRLLASQAYQESRFEPRARSWAGAAGLLQLMPPTAAEFGVSNVYDPEQNVAGAIRFLRWLTDYWTDIIPDDTERRKFILASYNTGHGHVEDARRLTEKNGGDSNVWADVAYWLLQKSKREVYSDPVVRYGFCRGLEPVTYVSFILDRYAHYQEFVLPSAPSGVAESAGVSERERRTQEALDQPST